VALDTKLKSGVDYLNRRNWAPGMNDDLAYADRAGFNTSVEMLTTGSPQDWTDFGTPDVGNPYDLDGMGEARSNRTFSVEEPKADGFIGMLPTESVGEQEGTVTTVSGKRANLSSPQTYSRGIKMPGKGD
jgi:hypothetical protein